MADSVALERHRSELNRTFVNPPVLPSDPYCISNGKKTHVRATHRLTFSTKKLKCFFCKVVHSRSVHTELYCVECKMGFCFNKTTDHFKLWHSNECDFLRGYS